jgi:CheY-like chemotaxis protein
MMGGRIEVRSMPGEGSTFWFTVRLDRPQTAAPAAETAPALREETAAGATGESRGERAGRGRFSEPRVLLVEDNPVNQMVIKAMVDRLGCRTDVAMNGRDALEEAAAAAYDLILMDCQMPEMDGYEATRAIRMREAGCGGGARRTPIVALTAHAMEGDREVCIESGMDDYLSKPCKPEELKAILAKWLAPV